MDSLGQILGDKNFEAPDEVTAVKEFIKRRYKSGSSVRLSGDSVMIFVPNSALAGTLRLEQMELIKKCGLKNKKLYIRAG